MIAQVAVLLLVAFLIGGIPWGLLLVRVFAGVDIRTIGSGKTGATNVLRVLGWPGFAAAVVLDILKGIIPVLLVRAVLGGGNGWIEAAAGFVAILGHTFSPYLGFRGGGRGMVTAMGAAFIMAPVLILLIPVFLIPVLLTRYMSLGNIVAAIAATILMFVLAVRFDQPWAYFAYVAFASALVIVNHKDNIQRILKGTERKIGAKLPT